MMDLVSALVICRFMAAWALSKLAHKKSSAAAPPGVVSVAVFAAAFAAVGAAVPPAVGAVVVAAVGAVVPPAVGAVVVAAISLMDSQVPWLEQSSGHEARMQSVPPYLSTQSYQQSASWSATSSGTQSVGTAVGCAVGAVVGDVAAGST